MYGPPNNLKIACNPSGNIEITFTCPRCGQHNYHQLDAMEFSGMFEIECNHPLCVAPGERYGYQLTFYATWNGSYMGESDRPLHRDQQ